MYTVGISPHPRKPTFLAPARSCSSSTPLSAHRNDVSPAVKVPSHPAILASTVSVPTAKNADVDTANSARRALVLPTPSGPPIRAIKGLSIRPCPELGLLSLLFVLSMAIGSVVSLAIASIPTMNAFRKTVNSMSGLSKVVAEEVPGTLSSLKLSGLEIDDLTHHLRKLRQRTSGSHGDGERDGKSGPFGRRKRNYPIVDT